MSLQEPSKQMKPQPRDLLSDSNGDSRKTPTRLPMSSSGRKLAPKLGLWKERHLTGCQT
jgi:hypothetical protein